MKCSACNSPWHPATGHVWTPTLVLCRNCTLDFIRWLKQRESAYSKPWRRDKSKTSFIEAALTSIHGNG